MKKQTINAILSTNIRKQVKRNQISLNRLADEAGISRSQLFNVLAEGTSPSIDWLDRLATALDTEVWKLLK